MIRLILLFVFLGAGLYVGTQFSGQQGYVLISIAERTIEMSVTTLVVLVVALLAILFGLEFIVKKILRASNATISWFSLRKLKRARRETNEGMILLMEGDWQSAEKKVTRLAKHHDTPLLCYLAAAEAAQGLGDTAKRDHYLTLASEQEDSDLAVILTRAKQQVADGAYQDALTTIGELHGRYNPIALKLQYQCYQALNQWSSLLELLPQVKKAKLINAEQQEQMTRAAHLGSLASVAEQQGSDGLMKAWEKLPRKLKQDRELILELVKQLVGRKADSQAYIILRDSLKKTPHDDLYAAIAQLDLPDIHPAVVLLQAALQRDGRNATVHSTLAQLLIRQENWGDAQQHLEQALKVRPLVIDYANLALVLEKQQQTQAANDVSRQALALVENL
ncbi:heme biosynthesis HemY N-terminal domain-containing protein [Vibrio sp. SCSIO 43136]|uniref:heme biosynthesis HemY N-terminal domain-containing protein n=1 Tax=Vibrio sp. SCSIO 43136 TaxID=2819101 RepID=UPI0020750D35|nr:heme biosynthesis HemY N-terminal domain-containing protein [Vibrio sp. SCSIO 43136]USD65359.1 heme biosynthesis protein HemY [Vibrio sp. SCSIO 43136]